MLIKTFKRQKNLAKNKLPLLQTELFLPEKRPYLNTFLYNVEKWPNIL